MEMSPQLARLVAWLEEMHARVMQAEQAALAVMGDMPAYTARMQEKARLLASLEEEGEAYLEELPEQLQDQAGHRLHRFRPAPATRCASAPSSTCPPCSIPKTTSPASPTTCRSSSGACATRASTTPCTRRTSGRFFPGAGGLWGSRTRPFPRPILPPARLARKDMTPAALRPFPDAGLPVLPRRSPHGRFREGRGKAASFPLVKASRPRRPE